MLWYIWYIMWCDMMIWYDIYWLQLAFRPVAMVGRLVQKLENDGTKGVTIHKTIQTQNKTAE